MQIQVEDVGPCKKLLKIEVPPEQVDEELNKTYEQLNDSVAVPGFRKGHVPRWLMESRFGKQVNEDAKQALVSQSLEDAIQEQDLKPIGHPQFDEDIAFEPGKGLSFGVTVEVQPEFEIEDYAGLTLKKPVIEPKKTEITQRVDLIRRRYAKLDELTEGPPQAGDVVLCHITVTDDGETFRDLPNHQFIVGETSLVGMDTDETTELVTGVEVGRTAERDVELPEDFPDEARRGAKMKLSVKVEGLRRPHLPRVTAKWVKEIGFDSLEEFREEVKGALTREKEREAQQALGEQVTEQLLKKVDFELPEDVVSRMAERMLVRRGLALRQQGVAPEEIQKQLNPLRTESKQSAEKSAKAYFIFEKIAEKERIFVTEDEVNARIEAMAANYGRSADQVLRDLEQNDRLGELRASMREEKVRAFLLEKADVKEPKATPKAKDKPEKAKQ